MDGARPEPTAERARTATFADLFPRGELVLYATGALVYIVLALLTHDVVLNWIIGPLFITLWAWYVPILVERIRRDPLAADTRHDDAMSWAAHEFENFALLKEFGVRTSYLGLLVGALGPDFLTKAWTYYGADNPAQFHRGWPGLGFTTSLGMAAIAAAITWKISRGHKPWTLGIFVGWCAHALTDTFDTAGAMLLWPFYWGNFSLGAWKYGAGQGKFGDAIAYYSSLGFAMDALALVLVLVFAWRTLSRDWFETMVRPIDPVWEWIQVKFAMPDRALLAFYRGFFFYGFCRFVSWSLIVHVVEGWPFDLTWGSPFWVIPYQQW